MQDSEATTDLSVDVPPMLHVPLEGEQHPVTEPTLEGITMADHPTIENIFKPDAMAGVLPALMAGGSGAGGMGAGLGAGLLGGVLGGVLLNRNGLLGGGVDANVNTVTPSLLASSLAQVTDTAMSTTVLQTLGDIKASIPLAEGQVQLALAGAQADINSNIADNHSSITAGQALINKNISDAIASSLAANSAVKEAVLVSSANNLSAIKDNAILAERNAWAITQAVNNDGEKTRALLIAQNDHNLQRQLTVAEAALAETRAVGRSRDVEVTVTQNVNQQQVQMQQQQQMQTLLSTVAVLAQQVNRSQQDIINVGGMMSGTAQTSANTNVR